jgi:membrane protein insertase Oxa1/YidC/SpoIIIJ
MNNKGGFLIGMLMFIISVLLLVAVLPIFSTIFNVARQSDHLNCAGYIDHIGVGTSNMSYNSSYSTDTISCVAVDIGVPFLVLAVIIGGIAAILAGRGSDASDVIAA